MPEITDQDRRAAIDVAEAIERGDYPMATMWPIMARVILATVDAPDPTLAEELRDVADNYNYGMSPRAAERVDDIADRVEHELAEARAEVDHLKRDLTEAYKTRDARDDEVERLTAVNENLRRTDNYRQFREKFLTVQKQLADVQKGAESNAESLDPADVPAGEAWLVEFYGEKRNAVKDRDDSTPWNTANTGGRLSCVRNEDVTLITRLVPAPRVITNADDLDRLPRHTVILSTDGQADVYQKDSNGEWVDVASHGYPSRRVIRIENAVTVLWEPEA